MDKIDKAGKNYWDSCWSKISIPVPINPREKRLSNYVNRRLHQYLSKVFFNIKGNDIKLLEIGCARSAWLPYFAREFGFSVTGIDYSEIGCQQAKMILDNSNIDGNVVCSDFFTPPDLLLNSFNVVISFGVVEHFEDTETCISALSDFLLPGGVMITVIPNMAGMMGILQRIFDRETYEIHIPLDKKDIFNGHEKAGLNVIQCEYFIPINFGVLNVNSCNKQSFVTLIKQFVLRVLGRLSLLIGLIDEKIVNLPSTFLFSSHIICVAQKKIM
ncbi:class I SAM-dependent methyltransferase [Anabaena aphanizomenioides LEGE 00250]|uniref:Class I SAM-dependent methyltransferase n=1 Tax=Sphaerospermopsis aphanizomenoides LEGE 00250 TaxID=2777972 RepID=A0ABR9VHR6_9CYAN|nr:class I SAM-dependent methyltransferase [Sphaerospermopsis aphanizomenoides]MBE9236940.1 class I SAM-dependent methyltransferase [Sphaerospermopsis aphanizomenoides LEGE 00250]